MFNHKPNKIKLITFNKEFPFLLMKMVKKRERKRNRNDLSFKILVGAKEEEETKEEPPAIMKLIGRGISKLEGVEDVEVDEEDVEALGKNQLIF